MYKYWIMKLAEKMEVDMKTPKQESYPPKQLKKGIEIEKEHTTNLKARERIAKNHLDENDKYYIPHLEDMEKKMKKEEKKGQMTEVLDVLLTKLAAEKRKDPVEEFAKKNNKQKLENADMSQYEFKPALTDFADQDKQYTSLENSLGAKMREAVNKIITPPPPQVNE